MGEAARAFEDRRRGDPTPKKLAIHSRFSWLRSTYTREESHHAIRQQIRLARRHCARLGHLLTAPYQRGACVGPPIHR